MTPPSEPAASDRVLARLLALHPKVIDLSLGRIERLLARLGHPERRLPPVVHVAGTNGKGSLIAYLRAMLEADGRRVQVYTSPHLARFHERIRLAGGLISEADLTALLEECEAANGGAPITFFEITTAAAFLAFSREPADVLLLEVGLGGRLDATNVIERPLATCITPISLDHMQYLGDTLAAIAFEKAGILKPGVSGVIGPQPPVVLETIERRAAAIGAPLTVVQRHWRSEPTPEGFALFGPPEGPLAGRSDWPRPALRGGHQVDNAVTALVLAGTLGALAPSPAARRRGLTGVVWPARLQRLTRGPLAEALPDGWELWLDGGHNAAAGEVLAASFADWADRPLHLVYGMLNTKAAEGFLRPLAPHAADLKGVAIPGEPATLSAAEATAHARACGMTAEPAESLEAALRAIVSAGGPPSRILICGSLYLAGQVLRQNG
ncbi:dihydrofolate synthase / folylpolyglutamate synthase [Tistlia consotensis]|uniref:Dihydrofolate synthase/folylpolyglutamate synthase n=1 Tax=Tistlia consotensis USBA 355 TaxID=560819 RepID=A0A1Y6BAL5_9PROT|nr:folylpolyglutamate synthase/dihydrofolate synthase family protein [Tistlia consotensis]SME94211.1 dihydrofolate synthase / folylpolyglutamate synthase [Tistlia consotensis USBA 355]SNR29173.1 dihydrofolate synthase / folylpolyglutamate synthase [Tistlia consotensis]